MNYNMKRLTAEFLTLVKKKNSSGKPYSIIFLETDGGLITPYYSYQTIHMKVSIFYIMTILEIIIIIIIIMIMIMIIIMIMIMIIIIIKICWNIFEII